MPSPTTAKVLLGHFPRGADPPVVCQHISPLPVWSLIYLSLREIPVARVGGGGTCGGAGRRRIPRDSRGRGRGAEGRSRDFRVAKIGTTGRAMGKIAVTDTMAMEFSRRRRNIEDPLAVARADNTGGKNRKEESDTDERAARSSGWSGEETEETVSEEKAENVGEREGRGRLVQR